MQKKVLSGAGYPLGVETALEDNRLRISLSIKAPSECTLHWGISRRPGGAWQLPPPACWPGNSTPAGPAVRTPFTPAGDGERKVTIEMEPPRSAKNLVFVLHLPRENRWIRDGGSDFVVELPRGENGALTPGDALIKWAPEVTETACTFTLDSGEHLAAGWHPTPEGVRILLAADADAPLLLHWGLAPRFRHEWKLPPESARPAGTEVVGDAARTPFQEREGLQWLELTLPTSAEENLPRWLRFVLFQPTSGQWLKANGTDLCLPLTQGPADPRLPSRKLQELAERIVEGEVGSLSWTLMHRFNLCHDLLGEAEGDVDALALLFAWLRYSAIRQLDWQRRYNTKPRDLSHAQDRLSQRVAALWRSGPQGDPRRAWARRMLATLGRGGDGQRVRDEILQIMHRNHIPEGHNFVEEWHQKLHNNTTPDDVVICAAYLAFLRGNGSLDAFYKTLEAGGVTRERLRSFERPIRLDPEFYPDKKDALLGEFEGYLRILKSVHSGADLESAFGAARGLLDGGLQGRLGALLGRAAGEAPVARAREIVGIREALSGLLGNLRDDWQARDVLFLDLALEDALRATLERLKLEGLSRDELAELLALALRNVALSAGDDELAVVIRHWQALLARPHEGADWALHALGVCERIGRWVQGHADELQARLQPKAAALGEACGVQPWVIALFSEEIIRGGPIFALSRVLHSFDALARKAAGVGRWRVISPGAVSGKVRVVPSLLAVQAERFAEPAVLVTEGVSGEEEIPEGVTAVLTTSRIDLVSHVAVRARNAGVLLACCYERELFEQLEELQGRTLTLQSSAGEVEYREGAAGPAAAQNGLASHPASPGVQRQRPTLTKWAVTAEEFSASLVGGKSNNLNVLRGKLPDWIHTPRSLALPFGAFEVALEAEQNAGVRNRYQALTARVEEDIAGNLSALRSLVLELSAPEPLKEELLAAWHKTGLPQLPWEQVWRGVTRVWASKWNDRAYLSRRGRGMAHEAVFMAVLIQEVVAADYAFVIHTVNPVSRDRDEVFAEVVLGLGETLVGNYPGQALGLVARKSDGAVRLVSYPSKSVGLYGSGVIFRSDSNAEDLEGFAGAGLYDSVLAEAPVEKRLDYSSEKLLWDVDFRQHLLGSVARVAAEVERIVGGPQDIEGAVQGGHFYVVQTRPQVGL